MAPGPDDDGSVVLPVLPRTPFANDPNVSIRERLDELDAVMRDVRRLENFAHPLRRRRRNEFPLLEQQKIAKQLPYSCGMGIVTHRIADALVALAIMLAHPDPSAVCLVIEMIRVEHGLDLFQPQLL